MVLLLHHLPRCFCVIGNTELISKSGTQRQTDRQIMLNRLISFAKINSSTDMIAFQWCYHTNIGDLVACNQEVGFKNNFQFVLVATYKLEKAHHPFNLATDLVLYHLIFIFLLDCGFGNGCTHTALSFTRTP